MVRISCLYFIILVDLVNCQSHVVYIWSLYNLYILIAVFSILRNFVSILKKCRNFVFCHPVHMSVCHPVCLSVCYPVLCLFVCLLLCSCVCLSPCPFVCLLPCLSLCMFIYPFIHIQSIERLHMTSQPPCWCSNSKEF
jgi:hypothetical protein